MFEIVTIDTATSAATPRKVVGHSYLHDVRAYRLRCTPAVHAHLKYEVQKSMPKCVHTLQDLGVRH